MGTTPGERKRAGGDEGGEGRPIPQGFGAAVGLKLLPGGSYFAGMGLAGWEKWAIET